jgi:type IV pilus assembly protein PilC
MKFTYQALTKDGKKESGSIDAATLAMAGHLLKEQGLIPTELKELSSGGLKSFFVGLQGVRLQEKIVFIEDLGLMLKILSKQTQNKKFSKVLDTLTHDIENGKALHEAMAKFPNVFSEIFVSMIKVGELGGNLDQSLQYLSVQLEREADLRAHVRGAMIYPAVIVGAMVIIGVVMGIYVLPKLTSVFKDFGTELPPLTRAVMAFSDFMAGHPLVVIGGLIGIVIAGGAGLRTSTGKQIFDMLLIRAPMVNPLVKKINLARFARVFSSLLKSGIPIVEGLKVSGESIPHVLYKNAVLEASEAVKVGNSLTDTLAKHEQIFPFIVVQMLQIGEETGNIETILAQLAEHYEAEVDLQLKNISSIIEPLLLLVIGSIVGVLAYALVIPIYNIGSGI